MTLSDWRDPDTGAFNLDPGVVGKGSDNGVLFTAVALKLGLITPEDFLTVLSKYFSDQYGILRYPGTPDFASYDDYLGAAAASFHAAKILSGWLSANKWTTRDGSWIGRFPQLGATVHAGSGEWVNPYECFGTIGTYLANCFESSDQTSGKQLLWLAAGPLYDLPGVGIWTAAMRSKYPGGPREMLSIYYTNPAHPFIAAAPSNWAS